MQIVLKSSHLTSIFLPLAIALAPLSLLAPAQAQSAPHQNPMLHQRGMKIVDGQGTEVQLRGVSLGGWLVWAQK